MKIFCAFIFATLLLLGCSEAKLKFNAVDISGIAGYGNDFHLTDHNGKARSMSDFRGKVVAIFFGYTHCPDVCPTTMAEMRQVMEKLGNDSERLQVLFVTVDPKRDTPELLAKYVPAFNPTFLGLYGDEAATKQVTKDMKIFFEAVPGKTPETYTVDHTAGTLVFDPQGRLRLFVNYGLSTDLITADFKQLLSNKN